MHLFLIATPLWESCDVWSSIDRNDEVLLDEMDAVSNLP